MSKEMRLEFKEMGIQVTITAILERMEQEEPPPRLCTINPYVGQEKLPECECSWCETSERQARDGDV